MRSRVSQTVTCAVLVVLAIPAIAAASHTHVVRPGDTLWSIARRYEVSVEALASANQLADPDALRLGQELIIPNTGEHQASSAPSNARLTHVVTAGDTLWSLARRYQVPVQTIVEANRLDNPDALRLGQTLVIPGGKALRPPRPGVPAAGQTGSGALRRPLPAAVVPSRGAKWGSALLVSASRYVGVRYRWGGMSPRGFDCSGFIGYVMRAVGVTVPRTTDAMWATGRAVTREHLRVGDVVFFTTTRPGPSHAGIYIGNNQFIHASSGFGRVTVTSLDYRYYRPRYLGARRF